MLRSPKFEIPCQAKPPQSGTQVTSQLPLLPTGSWKRKPDSAHWEQGQRERRARSDAPWTVEPRSNEKIARRVHTSNSVCTSGTVHVLPISAIKSPASISLETWVNCLINSSVIEGTRKFSSTIMGITPTSRACAWQSCRTRNSCRKQPLEHNTKTHEVRAGNCSVGPSTCGTLSQNAALKRNATMMTTSAWPHARLNGHAPMKAHKQYDSEHPMRSLLHTQRVGLEETDECVSDTTHQVLLAARCTFPVQWPESFFCSASGTFHDSTRPQSSSVEAHIHGGQMDTDLEPVRAPRCTSKQKFVSNQMRAIITPKTLFLCAPTISRLRCVRLKNVRLMATIVHLFLGGRRGPNELLRQIFLVQRSPLEVTSNTFCLVRK